MTEHGKQESYLEGLNSPQREAVLHTGGPLLVIAGAGSGKTRVLTYRIIHLIKSLGTSPFKILAITFTNKAAQEMKDRVSRLVGPVSRDMWISTFHSACARILRREAGLLGFPRSYAIYDEADSLRLIASCLEDLGIDRKAIHPVAVKKAISGAKNEMVDEEAYSDYGREGWQGAVGEVYKLYQERLRQYNAMDFDDLLLNTVHLFNLYPDVLKRYRERFLHVLVDEYQDTNYVQYQLVRLLALEHRNLCVVGDDDQGIYSWRGADTRNILEFEKDYPDARVIKLEQNYRSTQAILSAASTVVKNNQSRKEKTLWTENPPGELPVYLFTEDEHTEAAFVVEEILELKKGELKYQDAAVFYRTHAQSRVIEEALIKEGIPYRIFGGTRFYERKEIKDIIAYLKVLSNPKDEVSLKRIINVPRRGLGKATIDRIERYSREYGVSLMEAMRDADEIGGLGTAARKRIKEFLELMDGMTEVAEGSPLEELLAEIWDRTGYMNELEAESTLEAEGRIENLKELLTVVSDFRESYEATTVDQFLERVALINDIDELDESEGYVSLMTLHNAKGLEYPVVFMVGMEEGIFPHIRSMDSEKELEEERRLCYVGMTRAEERLYLISAVTRSLWGGVGANPLSRFVMEIPREMLEEREWEMEPARHAISVSEGERVIHAKWGPGTVKSVEEIEGDCEVVVGFASVGEKRLLLRYAPLSLEEDDDERDG